MQRVAALRKQFAQEFGLRLPAVRFVSEPRLSAQGYELVLHGVVYGRGDCMPTGSWPSIPVETPSM